MTEIIEYSLVVMVSTLFVAGSVLTYSSFSAFESNLQVRAAFATISGLVSQALESGNSSATLSLPSSTIRCEGGSLSISAGPTNVGESIPAACNFVVNIDSGAHSLLFSKRSSGLYLAVT